MRIDLRHLAVFFIPLTLCAIVDCGEQPSAPAPVQPGVRTPIAYWIPAPEFEVSDRDDPDDWLDTPPGEDGLPFKQAHGCGEEGGGMLVEEYEDLTRGGVARIKAFYKWRDGTHEIVIWQNNAVIATKSWGAGCARGSLLVELHEGEYDRGDVFTAQFASCAGWGPAGATGQMIQSHPVPPLANETNYNFWNIVTVATTEWRAEGPISTNTGTGAVFNATTGNEAGYLEVEQKTDLPGGAVSIARLFSYLDGVPHK